MTGAHLFYIPVLLLVGFFGGFFAGKRAAEQERVQAARRLKRRAALQEKRQAGQRDDHADEGHMGEEREEQGDHSLS